MTIDHGYPAVRMHIAGEWCQGGSAETVPVENPATQETIGTVALATADDLDRALA
ncbi:NAD-dependent succinate-semialdehyde dehydrogenase, partial [Streptomyces sp. SID89]|nr:NAD-dependent succinate-semialdehyde dehydrogenase [Streptomyces sp. SID89]